jgi:hypothetical protein
MVKTHFLPSADIERCPNYPPVSPFGFVCAKISLFCWTRFGASSGPVAASELPVREALRATPLAERAPSRSASGGPQRSEETLTAHSEPYNATGPASRAVDG